METNELNTVVEEQNPAVETQTFDGVVEPIEDTDGNSAGFYALLGLAIVGAGAIAKAAWKHAVKPGIAWAKTKLEERKAKKEQKEESASEADEDDSDSIK